MESAQIPPTQDVEVAQADQGQPPTQEHGILIELLEDLDEKREMMRKIEAVEEILHLKICARVMTFDRLSLSKALEYYTRQFVKR
jgi:hypothetical protein